VLGRRLAVHRDVDGAERLRHVTQHHGHSIPAPGNIHAESQVLFADDRIPIQIIQVFHHVWIEHESFQLGQVLNHAGGRFPLLPAKSRFSAVAMFGRQASITLRNG
jgi:hypothetical protein